MPLKESLYCIILYHRLEYHKNSIERQQRSQGLLSKGTLWLRFRVRTHFDLTTPVCEAHQHPLIYRHASFLEFPAIEPLGSYEKVTTD